MREGKFLNKAYKVIREAQELPEIKSGELPFSDKERDIYEDFVELASDQRNGRLQNRLSNSFYLAVALLGATGISIALKASVVGIPLGAIWDIAAGGAALNAMTTLLAQTKRDIQISTVERLIDKRTAQDLARRSKAAQTPVAA